MKKPTRCQIPVTSSWFFHILRFHSFLKVSYRNSSVAYINAVDVSSNYGNLIYMKVKTNINLVPQNQFIMLRNTHMI